MKLTRKFEDIISVENGRIRIHYDRMQFQDSHLFSPAARHFEEHGVYSFLDPVLDPKRWEAFWDEEKRRCLHGYTAPNGIYITGYHYHYLNYCPIDRVEDINESESKRTFGFPRFYDGDYLYFHVVEYARRNNKHLNLLKARRKGYSYKNASMTVRNYYHVPRSKNFILAGDMKFLDGKDATLNKCWDYLSHIDENTPWYQPRLKDASDYKKAGYKKRENGREVDKGLLSLIAGLSLKNNPDAARGAAGELVLWEESGKFAELLTAWEIVMPTVKQGAKTLGLMIAYGTGGTEGADFTSAEALMERPDVYDCLVFDNIWDDGASGTDCGFFHPNFLNLDGYIDKNGNSDIEGAAAYEQSERDKKKKGDSAKSYQQYVAEHAEKPSEAVLSSDANLFPTESINAQYNYVKSKKLENIATPGLLFYDEKGVIKFKPDPKAKPIKIYPHSKKDDIKGAVTILESPYRNKDGNIPESLYILCHDPYAHDSSSDHESLGACYVLKRTNNFSFTYNDCIVASYVGRPDTQDEFNETMFMLAEYYNAKIGFENDRGDVIGYAKRFKKLHMLQPEFEMLDNKQLQSQTVNRKYGMHMTLPRIEQAEIYIRDWLIQPLGTTSEDGKHLKVLNSIYDLALLKELLKYNNKGNFDRVRALMVGMFHRKELFNRQVAPVSKSRVHVDEFFSRMYA